MSLKGILDVGCGSGALISDLAKIGFNCVGIDISKIGIKRAKQIAKKRRINKRLSVILGDAENLPLRENSFDLVVCTNVLEHLINPMKSLKEMIRVVEVSGGLIISAPNMGSPIWRANNTIDAFVLIIQFIWAKCRGKPFNADKFFEGTYEMKAVGGDKEDLGSFVKLSDILFVLQSCGLRIKVLSTFGEPRGMRRLLIPFLDTLKVINKLGPSIFIAAQKKSKSL